MPDLSSLQPRALPHASCNVPLTRTNAHGHSARTLTRARHTPPHRRDTSLHDAPKHTTRKQLSMDTRMHSTRMTSGGITVVAAP